MMDSEILQLILQKLEGMDKRFDAMDKRFDAMDKRFDAMDKRMDTLEQSVTDLRHALFLTEQNLTEEIKISRDMLPLSIEKWDQSLDLMAEVKAMFNEHKATKIAVDATLVNHEGRITGLEQKAG